MRRRGAYGIDAPSVAAGFLAAVVAFAVLGIVTGALTWLVMAAIWLLMFALAVHASLRGKFLVWTELLDQLALQGHERVLDVCCGRGAVLLLAAGRLPSGRAVGVDLWRSRDQSGNDPEATRENAVAEGVADRVELVTADMTELPFEDGSFDLVVSSLAIHNVHPARARAAALAEAVRVLRPGGRMLIVDLPAARRYPERLREFGMDHVASRGVGWRMWWGGPWVGSTLVSAAKPTRRLA